MQRVLVLLCPLQPYPLFHRLGHICDNHTVLPALVVAKRTYLYYMMVHNPLTIHNILDVSYVVVYVVVRALGSVGGVTMAWPVYRHNIKVCVGNGAVNTLCHMFQHQGVTYM